MNYFERQGGELCAEGVPLSRIAAQFGTPTYVYSKATLTRHVQVLSQGVSSLPHVLCYAIKSNGNLAVLQVMKSLGCGFDAVSVGELMRALKIGADPNKTIVSGVGKRDDEIAAALRARVLYVCIESEQELTAVAQVAASLGVRAPVSIRVNPDVDAKTHPYIATGLKENKFGVPMAEAQALYRAGHQSPHLEMVGVTCHIGSQITELPPFLDAAERMTTLTTELRQAGLPLRHLGMGGGLGVPYKGLDDPPPPEAYGKALTRVLAPLGLTIIFEPGRVIVGNAGVLLTRVVRIKITPHRKFVILDAGMNDLMRPALYQAHHEIEPVGVHQAELREVVDVVGPVCESADTFAQGRALPPVQSGDLLALRTAGAYGFAMSSTYNGRPLCAEVMCDGETAMLIRARQTLADLWHGERLLDGTPVDDALPSA